MIRHLGKKEIHTGGYLGFGAHVVLAKPASHFVLPYCAKTEERNRKFEVSECTR